MKERGNSTTLKKKAIGAGKLEVGPRGHASHVIVSSREKCAWPGDWSKGEIGFKNKKE